MISSSKPFEIEGDLEVSLLGAFRSSLLFCSTEKKPTSLLGRLTLFAQGSHTAVCTEMSGEGGDHDWLRTDWCFSTQHMCALNTV